MREETEKYLTIYIGRSIKLVPFSILLGVDHSIDSSKE